MKAPSARRVSAAIAMAIAGIGLATSAASAASSTNPTSGRVRTGYTAPATPAPAPTAVPAARRAAVLGADWRGSRDVLWNLVPGPGGLAVVTAPVAAGAPWNTVASLSVATVQSRQWIGQGCVLAGTHTAAVAFGPVEYISTASLFERGAFAAVVDLDTGAVRYVPGLRPSFSYFSPKCGGDGTAEFTTFGSAESTTAVTAVDARGRATTALRPVAGEFTDLVRVGHRLVGARGRDVVAFGADAAGPVLLARAAQQVFGVQAGADGSIVYATNDRTTTHVRTIDHGQDREVASGPVGHLAVDAVAGRGVAVHGAGARAASDPPAAAAAGVRVSQAADDTVPGLTGTVFTSVAPARAGHPTSLRVSSAGGSTQTVSLPPQLLHPASPAQQMSPAATAATTSGDTTDANLPCAVKRNDVATEAYQPSVQQAEWAVDQAVVGQLTTSHPANYRHFGLPAYSPQGNFPLTALSGGGSIPPQVMLGVLANESNLWQASSHVAPGGYGNPLTGNIYGRSSDALTINFSNADCGYGIAQVTDGMRTGQMDATLQREIAMDYQANIAAGINILAGKWNQLQGLGITMNDGTPSSIENWYAALWAYNTGLQPNSANGNTTGCSPGPNCTDSAGFWGLGWFNNPANPIYPASRHMFNSQGTDAAKPGNWPYQERVIGWAAYPIYEPNGSYSQAYWLSDSDRTSAVPSPALFCDSTDSCSGASTTAQGSCAQSNAHCWIHHSASWKGQCATNGLCGYGQSAYSAGKPEPADPTSTDPADCSTSGLPTGAVIVDDLSTPSPYSPCAPASTTGSFTFTFTADANGNYPAHIDLHQVNGGFNGHYWFTHTVQADGVLPAIGTWHFPSSVNGWGQVLVHVPAQGAQTFQAHYTVTDGSNGATRTRVINTDYGQNAWISLGSMHLGTNSTVALTSLSAHDTSSDVAWDAVAFVPGAKPAYKIVALGDSYSSGEGDEPFDSIPNGNAANACHRSVDTYSRHLVMPRQSTPAYTNSADELDLIACSGAHTVSITSDAVNTSSTQENPHGSGWGAPGYQNGLETQLAQGWVDADTNVVTLTIGGNDARFSDVIQYCMGVSGGPTIHNCSDSGQIMPGDTQDLKTTEPHIISDLMPAKLQATYNAIHALAPNAVIIVGGYPQLFTPQGDDGICLGMIAKGDKLWLNSMGALMDSTVQSSVKAVAAAGVKIYYADPEPTFSGHEECTSNQYLNGVDLVNTVYSFHPNSAGQENGYTPAFQSVVNAQVP